MGHGASLFIVKWVNFFTLVVSLGLLGLGIWLATKHGACEKFLMLPVIGIGAFTFFISLLGFVGAWKDMPSLLLIYLVIFFFVLAGLALFIVFAFVITNDGAGHAVRGEGYKDYKLADYSQMLQQALNNTENWRHLQDCLFDDEYCSGLGRKFHSISQLRRRGNSIESGCCSPPQECGFPMINASTYNLSVKLRQVSLIQSPNAASTKSWVTHADEADASPPPPEHLYSTAAITPSAKPFRSVPPPPPDQVLSIEDTNRPPPPDQPYSHSMPPAATPPPPPPEQPFSTVLPPDTTPEPPPDQSYNAILPPDSTPPPNQPYTNILPPYTTPPPNEPYRNVLPPYATPPHPLGNSPPPVDVTMPPPPNIITPLPQHNTTPLPPDNTTPLPSDTTTPPPPPDTTTPSPPFTTTPSPLGIIRQLPPPDTPSPRDTVAPSPPDTTVPSRPDANPPLSSNTNPPPDLNIGTPPPLDGTSQPSPHPPTTVASMLPPPPFQAHASVPSTSNDFASLDCPLFDNAPGVRCFACTSCKVGVAQYIKKDWRLVAVVNIVIFITLVFKTRECQ